MLHVVRVSDCAILRVLVDDGPKIDFPFSALPSAATTQGDVKETEPKHFVREVNRDGELDLPAGKHTIELKNLGGDWVSLASAKLTGAKSSRYADLFVYALQDSAAGETIGQRLKRLRLERGLSQRELAAPGVSYAYISRIEAGTRQPSVKALRRLTARVGT
jgi:DNA-binding XRE family transcriptional regulator